MSEFPLVSTSNGILAVGGFEYTNGLYDWARANKIFQLMCPEGQEVSDCHWKEFPQKLKFARSGHVVIPLPVTYELCNN